SACNHGWSASDYLAALPPQAVGEIHLAGHAVRQLEGGGVIRIDDHGSEVCPQVWALYSEPCAPFGPLPTLIEWDTDLPPLDVPIAEARSAQNVLDLQADERRCAI